MSENTNPGNNNDTFADLIVAEQHVDTVSETALAVYENRDIVRELVARLMMFHPAAAEVGKRGMIQVAQLALTMGASPFPNMNEIHVYPDNRGGIVVQPGINFWLRRAIYYGGVRWIDPVRPMSIDEIELYQIDAEYLGAICRGVRQREFLLRRRENHELGIDEPVSATLRSMTITGMGIVNRASTYQYKNQTFYTEAKTGRPLIWTAEKRAETDFYKRAFPFIPGERVPAGAGMIALEKPDGDVKYVPKMADRQWRELSPDMSPAAAEKSKHDGDEIIDDDDNAVIIPDSVDDVRLYDDPRFDYDDPGFDPNIDDQPGLFDGPTN